jgi:hypothetical protein
MNIDITDEIDSIIHIKNMIDIFTKKYEIA